MMKVEERLKNAKEQGKFPPEQVYRWAVQLAEVLDYLHRQDPPVIHSDIKPANIMLTPQGDICLIDFNISLAFDSSLKTSTGISGGYSPPEQYRNMVMYQSFSGVRDTQGASETVVLAEQKKETAPEGIRDIIGRGVDERSDIYSLGATLYHLLTGVKPDRDFEKIVPIDQYHLALSEGFAAILNKMMQLRPENRYQNGGELLEAFRHIYELDTEYKTYRAKRRGMKLTAAALLDLGAGREAVERALASLPVDGFSVAISRVKKSGLDACDFDVRLDAAHENHDHDMEYLFGGRTAEDEDGHVHAREHTCEDGHAHDEGHDHGTEVRAEAIAGHDHEHTHDHEHHHNHDHAHNHSHPHPHEHRGMKEILEIIAQADMTERAKATAVRVFEILAEAEAKAHGVSRDEVHFHEVGAVDSIVDITAAAVCLDNLNIGQVIIPSLKEGSGTIRCQHGVLPVPVPTCCLTATVTSRPRTQLPCSICPRLSSFPRPSSRSAFPVCSARMTSTGH